MSSLVEDLSTLASLRAAWREVAARRGVPGIDRVSIEEFEKELDANLDGLAEEIRTVSYRPLPVLRIRPRFLAASDRALVVPAVRDRVVQRAISDLLTPKVEPLLSPACRAFRKGFSARQAAEDVGRWVEEGSPWVLRADVKSFFERIRPGVLEEKLEPLVDPEGLQFLRRILRQRIFDHFEVSEMVVGIPQGSPLSPLLGNLYLAELDAELLRDHPRYLRYCDDLLVLEESETGVQQARDRTVELLDPLGLELNEDKTALCRVEDGFTFLGYHFDATGRGPAVKAVEALHGRLEELAAAEPVDVAALDAVYRGWTAYFGDHPGCWTSQLTGLLALLRAEKETPNSASKEGFVDARRSSGERASPGLALELGRAWAGVGLVEQSWLELARLDHAASLGEATLESWSEILGIDRGVLGQILSKLAGPAKERLAALRDALAECGQYEIARRLAAERSWTDVRRSEEGSTSLEELEPRDVRILGEWFQGREGVHARETVRGSGHRTFVAEERPISVEDWQAHLRGEITLALPVIRAGDSTLLGVLDIDIGRKTLDEHHGLADKLLGRALGAALKLREKLVERGCEALVEFSGYKGYHLWVRLDTPVPCFRLRRWLLGIVREAQPLPEGIRVEVFPDRDRLRGDQLGPVVKLPLGVHSKTGKRCTILDEGGEPVDDPIAALRAISQIPAAIVGQTAMTATEGGAASGGDTETPEIGRQARQILEGCRVLGYLADKVEKTHYLDHRERSTLLLVLGHLGEEGRNALHAIIGKTYNYRRDVTDRHIEGLPEWPISCPKVRERHPEAAAIAPCVCRFELRGRGYPTPLLYALRPAQIPAFRDQWQQREAVSSGAGSEKPTAKGREVAETGEDVEAVLRKIRELKRHRRGIDASLDRAYRELARLFDQAGTTTLESALGSVRRIPKTEGEGWDFVIEV